MTIRSPLVMKFGGTSVADDRAFETVARIITERISFDPVIIVSAMSGMTDALLASARQAEDGHLEAAIASLDEVFTRHKTVAENLLAIENAADIIARIDKAADEVAGILERISRELPQRQVLRDSLLAYGEILSSDLLAGVLRDRGLMAQQIDARQCILTNDEHGGAAPSMPDTFLQTRTLLAPLIESGVIPVLGGFIGATAEGTTTTLGRGGSDYSAALV